MRDAGKFWKSLGAQHGVLLIIEWVLFQSGCAGFLLAVYQPAGSGQIFIPMLDSNLSLELRSNTTNQQKHALRR